MKEGLKNLKYDIQDLLLNGVLYTIKEIPRKEIPQNEKYLGKNQVFKILKKSIKC